MYICGTYGCPLSILAVCFLGRPDPWEEGGISAWPRSRGSRTASAALHFASPWASGRGAYIIYTICPVRAMWWAKPLVVLLPLVQCGDFQCEPTATFLWRENMCTPTEQQSPPCARVYGGAFPSWQNPESQKLSTCTQGRAGMDRPRICSLCRAPTVS